MFCDRCGAAMETGQNYCPACGRAFGAPAARPTIGLGRHWRILGILWLVLAATRLLPGIFMLGFSRHAFPMMMPGLPHFLPHLMHGLGGLFLLGGVTAAILGWGFLQCAPWARTLGIVLACLMLLDIPFGTALGVYTLWVLLPNHSREEYRRL